MYKFEHAREEALFKSQRTRKALQIAQYNWIILPGVTGFLFWVIYNALLTYLPRWYRVDRSISWNYQCTLYIILVCPGHIMMFLSFLGACFPLQPFRLQGQPKKRDFRKLRICLVTRGTQVPTVQRSVDSIASIYPRLDPRISFHILTEKRNASNFTSLYPPETGILIHGVPDDYTARKAKYKARSLEWFRINLKLQDDDWVLHIDEETQLDEYSLRACIDFIQNQDFADMGQGLIYYNSHDFWQHLIPTVGDIARVQEDYGRFQFQANWLGRAMLGVHGSFLIMSGKVENAVTWETDNLTEDYWFSSVAMGKGFRIGWIPAIARELSPSSVHDYLRQRRRWFTGIRTLNRFGGRVTLTLWLWVLFKPFYWIICITTNQWLIPVPRWFYALHVLDLVVDRTFCAFGIFVQDYDAGLQWSQMIWTQTTCFLLGPLLHFIDSYAVLTALLFPEKGFFIINKD